MTDQTAARHALVRDLHDAECKCATYDADCPDWWDAYKAVDRMLRPEMRRTLAVAMCDDGEV